MRSAGAARPLLDARTFASFHHRVELPPTALSLFHATVRRVEDTLRARSFDAVLVQREALLSGPPLIMVDDTHRPSGTPPSRGCFASCNLRRQMGIAGRRLLCQRVPQYEIIGRS